MIRKVFLLTVPFTLVSLAAFSQHQAVGLRLGDPMGVTYKLYSPSGKATEFLLGTASRNWHRNYYENSFYDYDKYDGYTYRSHRVENVIYLQARYLLHYDLHMEGVEGKFQWYWGLGGMLKFGKVEYRYYGRTPESSPGMDIQNNVDFGPEGIGGVEYTFEDVPLTVFGEASLMFEIVDRPLTLQLYGGVGIRYNF